MAGLKKFTITNSGTLVYRTTGKAYRGEYTLKVTASGVINVYGKNGRRMGTVAAPTTKKAQREIERLDKKRKANKTGQQAVKKAREAKQAYDQRMAERRAIRQFTAESSGLDALKYDYRYTGRDWAPAYQSYLNVMGASGEAGALAYRNYYGQLPELGVIQGQNLAKWLEAMVNDGTYTVDKANDYYNTLKTALANGDDEVADAIWYQVMADANDYGRYDSDQ